MPQITTKALAEFLSRPITDQMRILAEQKRPSGGAAAHKVHYYQSARAAVARYFRHGNDVNRIQLAIARVQASNMAQHKITHNIRAMNDFLQMTAFTGRILVPFGSATVQHTLQNCDIRLFPDLSAAENNRNKFFLINFSQFPVDPDYARRALELSYWLHNSAGLGSRYGDFEFIDVTGQTIYRNNRRPRATVVRNATQNITVINQLWPIV